MIGTLLDIWGVRINVIVTTLDQILLDDFTRSSGRPVKWVRLKSLGLEESIARVREFLKVEGKSDFFARLRKDIVELSHRMVIHLVWWFLTATGMPVHSKALRYM